MRKKKIWRYYCDFCNKGGCHAGHMRHHESRCTMNPNRQCGLCDLAGIHNDLKELTSFVSANKSILGEFYDTKSLSEMAEGCPACMLAAARQSGVIIGYKHAENNLETWNFKNESKRFLNGIEPDYRY